jgi:hypothetical protein
MKRKFLEKKFLKFFSIQDLKSRISTQQHHRNGHCTKGTTLFLAGVKCSNVFHSFVSCGLAVKNRKNFILE